MPGACTKTKIPVRRADTRKVLPAVTSPRAIALPSIFLIQLWKRSQG
jgi:hypothetical protein